MHLPRTPTLKGSRCICVEIQNSFEQAKRSAFWPGRTSKTSRATLLRQRRFELGALAHSLDQVSNFRDGDDLLICVDQPFLSPS